MKFSKIPAILLLSAVLLASCAETSAQPDGTEAVTQPPSSETAETADALPVKDFEQYPFKILTYNNMYDEHRAEEQTGDTVNDAVYARNLAVEEAYNVEIVVEDMADNVYQNTLKQCIAAGEDAYDLYQIFLSPAAHTYVPAGYFIDWAEIPYVNENLDKPWWNVKGQEQLKIRGKNYLMTGDLGYLYIGNCTSLLFNKTLFRDNDIAYPYDDVLAGTWTIDKLMADCIGFNQDLNGDGVMSPKDDRYGFGTTEWIAPISLFVGFDLQTLKYDDTGYPHLNLMTERTLSAYDKVYSLIVENEVKLDAFDNNPMSIPSVKMLMEDRCLVCAQTLANAAKLRDMDSDFGIVPNPKYDEKQESYISSIDAGTSAAAIGIPAQDLDRTGLIVEALCEKGCELVIPAYYDILLQGKSARDEESLLMLDIIRETAAFDPLYVYSFGFGFCFKGWLQHKTTDIASEYAKQEKESLGLIEQFWDSIADAE